jgi:SAM-dependent methyltransferase
MKLCLQCSFKFDDVSGWRCPSCGMEPQVDHGIPFFAPALEQDNDGFPGVIFEKLFKLESGNFWFRARNKLIIWAIQHHFGTVKQFLEIGCGTGYVLAGIENNFPSTKLYGSEIHGRGLKFAAKRLPDVELLQMDARLIPFIDEFDLIGAFDVLEHVEEDETVLRQMRKSVRNRNGGIIVTVPQHKFLWSYVDEYSCHVRRYTAVELRDKVEAAGFEVVLLTSFVSLLLPIMLAARVARGGPSENFDPEMEFRIPKLLNKLLELVMSIEFALIKSGLRFFAGGSLLLVARAR